MCFNLFCSPHRPKISSIVVDSLICSCMCAAACFSFISSISPMRKVAPSPASNVAIFAPFALKTPPPTTTTTTKTTMINRKLEFGYRVAPMSVGAFSAGRQTARAHRWK